jgi:hypothetical protein
VTEGIVTVSTEHLDPADRGDDSAPLAPPPAPRDLTPAVRRRSWIESRVRIWWLMGLILLMIAGYYAVSRIYFWNEEARLIRSGTKIEAEVMHWDIGGIAPKGKVVPADTGVDLEYIFNGQTYRVHGQLAGRKEQIVTRTMVPIFIDPANPTHWTARMQPSSLAQELLSAMLLAPIVVVLFAVSVLQRFHVLRIYREGDAVLAEVVGIGHSAAAPLSRLVRCALHGGREARVVKVLLPAGKTPDIGQLLWLIAPANRPEQALPAALFE